MSWRRNNSLNSLNNRRFFIYIPKDGKISFADNFPVRDYLDEELAKAERAYDEEEKSFKRLQTSFEYYANRIEDTKETLRQKMSRIENIKAQIAERDKNKNGI